MSQDDVVSGASPPPSFPLFPRLPAELRHEIWAMAAAEPQTIHLLGDGGKPPERIVKINGDRFIQPPAFLLVNRESRAIAVRRYSVVAFQMTVWINCPEETMRLCLCVKEGDVVIVHCCTDSCPDHKPHDYRTSFKVDIAAETSGVPTRRSLSHFEESWDAGGPDTYGPLRVRSGEGRRDAAQSPYYSWLALGIEDAYWLQSVWPDIPSRFAAADFKFWDEGPLTGSGSEWPRRALAHYKLSWCDECAKVAVRDRKLPDLIRRGKYLSDKVRRYLLLADPPY